MLFEFKNGLMKNRRDIYPRVLEQTIIIGLLRTQKCENVKEDLIEKLFTKIVRLTLRKVLVVEKNFDKILKKVPISKN